MSSKALLGEAHDGIRRKRKKRRERERERERERDKLHS
jgi:hypothetical protein